MVLEDVSAVSSEGCPGRESSWKIPFEIGKPGRGYFGGRGGGNGQVVARETVSGSLRSFKQGRRDSAASKLGGATRRGWEGEIHRLLPSDSTP